jgi:guanylate kinase
LTKEEFLQRKANDEFVETAEVFANFYGTLKSEVLSIAEKGENVLLDIDVQGAIQIKEACRKDEALAKCCEFIFIVPPSLGELERRLRSRATDSEEQITLRLGKAKHELSFWKIYDYIIANDDVEVASSELLSVIKNFSLQSKKFTEEPF